MSWRRATAPPFGPDGTFSFAGGNANINNQNVASPPFVMSSTSSSSSNNPQQAIFRKRLEQAITGVANNNNNNTNSNSHHQYSQQQQQQIYSISLGREQEGIIRSPRRGGGFDPSANTNSDQQQQQTIPSTTSSGGVTFMTGSGALRNAHGDILAYQQNQLHHQQTTSHAHPGALNALSRIPPYNYQYFHPEGIQNTNTNSEFFYTSSPQRGVTASQNIQQPQPFFPQQQPENQVITSAVEGAINSARMERDQARRQVVHKQIETLQLRREASDAANTALSSHRQHMMVDNALRTAEARIFQLERALEAEALHCETQIRKANQAQNRNEGEHRQLLEQEHEAVLLLNEAVLMKDEDVDALKRQLDDANQLIDALTRQAGDKQAQIDRLEIQVGAMAQQKSELSAFYEKNVLDSNDVAKTLQRRHKEEILAMRADHSMQKIRLDEALTRATIGEDASRQALEVIHTRLGVLCSSLDSESTQRERSSHVLAQALGELKAATASALCSLSEEHRHSAQQVDLELAQEGELRTQIRRLQAALESATDDKSRLQTTSEVLLRDLNSATKDLGEARSESARLKKNQEILSNNCNNNNNEVSPISPASHSEIARQALGKEVTEEVIENGLQEYSRQRQRQQQQNQQNDNNNNINKNLALDTTLTPQKAREKQIQQQQRELYNYYSSSSQHQGQQKQELNLNFLSTNNNNHYQNNQQQQPQHLISPRVGSIASRLNVVSVRGLTTHPALEGKRVKVCTLVFGPLGQQLCDIECDEVPVQVNNNNNNNQGTQPTSASPSTTFSNQSYHFKRDGRFPVTVYLHPSDPAVVIVHVWAKIVGNDNNNNNSNNDNDDSEEYDDLQQLENLRAQNKGVLPVSLSAVANATGTRNTITPPRIFLGCAILPVADILHRGPGTRVLALRERDPHESDGFIHNQARNSLLGFISIDVSGPFAACVDAPPLQNDALNHVLNYDQQEKEEARKNKTNLLNKVKQQRNLGGIPPPSIPALNLGNNGDNSKSNNNNNNNNQIQRNSTIPSKNTISLSSVNHAGSALSTFTADIWVRSVTYINPSASSIFNKLFFCEVVNKSSRRSVLTTPKISLMGLVLGTGGGGGGGGRNSPASSAAFDSNNYRNINSAPTTDFWPRTDASITVTLARNEGFLLQLFETSYASSANNNNNVFDNENQQQQYFSASGSTSATGVSPPVSAGGRLRPNIQGDPNCKIQTNNLIGCCDLDGAFLLTEFSKPTTQYFGGNAQSDRKSISVYLEQKHDVGVTTAIVELVVRIVP